MVGAAATGLVTVIVIWTKFAEGAWLVIVAIPLLVLMFLGINRHYRRFGRRLQAGVEAVRLAGRGRRTRCSCGSRRSTSPPRERSGTRGSIARGRPFRALLAPGRHTDPGIRPRWWDFAQEEPRLEMLPVDEGRMQALLEEVWRLPRGESDFVTVVVPEQFRRASLLSAAGRTSFRLKLRLLSEPGVVVTDVPVVTTADARSTTRRSKLVVRVLLANVHAGAMRAITYANSLGVDDMRAVSFAFDDDGGRVVPRRSGTGRARRSRST